jgi:hypothetical protein
MGLLFIHETHRAISPNVSLETISLIFNLDHDIIPKNLRRIYVAAVKHKACSNEIFTISDKCDK